MSRNIFSLLEGVECDPAKVIENAMVVHKASPSPAPAATNKAKIAKKEVIAKKEISKDEAALDLQQHLLYLSQFRNRRSQGRGYDNGYSSNGRQQGNLPEKDGELNINHNNNRRRYYENGNGYQGGSRGGYNHNNRYRSSNGGGHNKNQPQPEIVDQGSASNDVQGDDWQEVVSRRQENVTRFYGYRNGRWGYNNGWHIRRNDGSYNGSESTERNEDTNGVDGSEPSPDIDTTADIGSEKAPTIDAAAADNVDAKSEIGIATGDSKSEAAQGDGGVDATEEDSSEKKSQGADATGKEESSEKKSEGEEKKKKKKKSKSKKGDPVDMKEREAQPTVDDRKLMTLKEYEKLQLQKKEALESLKSSEGRQVRVDKDLESMQLVEKRKEESAPLKKKDDKEQAEKKKATNKKMSIDEFAKPQNLAGGRPRGGGNHQHHPERRNYGDGQRFNNQAGSGSGNYQNQQQRANYGEGERFDRNQNRVGGERASNGGRGARGRGSGGVNHNNSISSAGGDGPSAAAAAAGAGASLSTKGGKEFDIDPSQFPVLVREK